MAFFFVKFFLATLKDLALLCVDSSLSLCNSICEFPDFFIWITWFYSLPPGELTGYSFRPYCSWADDISHLKALSNFQEYLRFFSHKAFAYCFYIFLVFSFFLLQMRFFFYVILSLVIACVKGSYWFFHVSFIVPTELFHCFSLLCY